MIVQQSDAVLTAAHDYARRGWRVVPLHGIREDGSCTCQRGAICSSAGKHPVEARWQQSPAMSGADIQAVFEEGSRNLGLATGDEFWVMDIDLDKPGTIERVRLLLQDRPALPETRIVRTPGGWHYYFRMPDFRVTNSAKRLPDGVDVRGAGGQVVAPPSVSNKGVYTLTHDAPIADAPDWLLDLVRPLPPTPVADLADLPKLEDLPDPERKRLESYANTVVQREKDRLIECKDRGWQGPPWNQTTFEVACSLLELANSPWCIITRQYAHDVLLDYAPRDENFGEQEIEDRFTSALRTVGDKPRAYPEGRPTITVIPGDPLTDPTAGGAPVNPGTSPKPVLRAWTDLGNAHRMVDLYGDKLRWVVEAESWAIYDAGRWTLAGPGAARGFVQEMVEGLVDREAEYYSDEPTGPDGNKPSMREQFVKFAHLQQSSTRISAVLKECTGRPALQARTADFDADPLLLNCINGVVDLQTGALRPHDPSLLLMLQSSVAYQEGAEAPRWRRFLDRVQPDPEVQRYIQKIVGYSLTGSLAEQALFIHHGRGANGKSVFLVVASLLAGTYGQTVPRETLLARSGGGSEHPTSVARMRGRRFLQASETAAGRRLDEETVKGLTGGEQQSARYMGKDFFDFTPTGKIHLITNHLPRLTDAESIWRRLHLIKWGVRIPDHEKNPAMLRPEYWEPEAGGLLSWAVAGALAWQAEGLVVPESMRRDLMAYRTDQDILGEFLSDRLVKDESTFTASADIYGAYSAWCYNAGIRQVMTRPDLTRALRERDYEAHRTGTARGFRCRLLPVSEFATVDPLVIN